LVLAIFLDFFNRFLDFLAAMCILLAGLSPPWGGFRRSMHTACQCRKGGGKIGYILPALRHAFATMPFLGRCAVLNKSASIEFFIVSATIAAQRLGPPAHPKRSSANALPG
jgi:hypothetical protein